MAQLSVTLATEAELPSLSTVVPRAFHKSNDYFRQTLPNTSLIREWWHALLKDALQDSNYHVFTIIYDRDISNPHHAIGILLLRRIQSNGSGENVFDRHPPTADHDQTRYAAMLSGSKGGPREKFMHGQAHFSLDLFGVDDQFQGTGLGKQLLLKACEVANAAHLDIFVQANMYARAYYEKRGYVCVEEVVLPGPEKYGEVFMIYRAAKKSSNSVA